MHPIKMKVFIILVVCFLAMPVCAEEKDHSTAQPKTQETDYRTVEALKSVGVRSCVGAISTMTKYMYSKDDFDYVTFWNKESSDKHMSLILSSKPYSDG